MGMGEREENIVGSLLNPLCIHRMGSAVALETGKVGIGAGIVLSAEDIPGHMSCLCLGRGDLHFFAGLNTRNLWSSI